jgi:peptidoglycan/xylan/chitin deacetylase (PgdA/CDA1 family)
MPGKAVTALRRWRYRRQPGVLVLRYHRVAQLESDPHAIAVHPQSFREHLEILRSRYAPRGLSNVVRALEQGNLPNQGVVVTFDDGYADNLWEAMPALEQYEIPATVFVTTGYIGRGREFWWDELERVLLQPGYLPETLSLDIDGRTHEWNLGRAARYSADDYARYRSWNWRQRTKPTGRHRLFRRLFRLLQPMGERARNAVLQALRTWAGAVSIVRPTHRVLTPDELVRLSQGPLLEIGAHSVTHPLLPKLPVEEQVREIKDSKAFLHDVLGTRVDCFAYPYGEAGNAPALVRSAGFTSACTTSADVVLQGDDPYHLPRLYVGNWDGEEFERQIRSLV